MPESVHSSLAGASDEELASRVRSGDVDAFSVLVQRHEDRIFGLAIRIVGRREEARDVAQEVLLGFWQDPGAWKPSAKFTTWLYRVTSNRAISHLRMRSIKRLLSFSDHDPSDTAEDPSPPPDEAVESADRELAVQAEVKRLPARQIAAVHLRYQEGLSVAEVAESLGVSLKSAESLLFRARETLRQRLLQYK